MVEIGCGLVSLGREWGFRGRGIPDEATARQLLETAVGLGIRVFDTAPSYGTSEERLGRFLAEIDPAERERLLIGTKCGEQFDERAGSVVDHSPSALRRSIERSLCLLGRVAILQIHKATRAVIEDDAVLTLLEAVKRDVGEIGASVKDFDGANAAIRCPLISVIQFPYNIRHPDLAPVFAAANAAGKKIFVNRPLGEGSLVYDTGAAPAANIAGALSFILKQNFDGYILIGTRSSAHLTDDVRIFRELTAASSSQPQKPAGQT
ncbi:MAG TPA: aldo/keto reductase [Thermoanaerobaculia bacterium]|jgi:aryl-alcohol dehydrogenase-like predicted oxidoreductase|nr:aldo/keto reductase [Thermoanaerobaculia bacterium]